MGYSTVYDVKVRYSVDGRGAQGTRALANDTRALRNEVQKTTGAFGMLGTAVVGAFGVRAAGQALLGFNATVEDTKLQIAGMLSLAKKTDLADQIKTADGLYARLQKRAASLPGTTQEYVNMAGKITRVITDAGGTVAQLEDMTVSAVVAARSLGEHWEVAARDIEQGLMGRYNTTDPFLSKILPTIGYKGEEGRDKWRALSAEKRLEEMKRALGQKQIAQLGEAQGQTFSGAVSTLKDTIEQFLGKIGLPLFKAITKEIRSWNEWIGSNQERVDQIAQSIGQGLVKGFEMVRDAIGFIVRHADMLIAIGKVWAAVKIGGMIGSMVDKGRGGVGGIADRLSWFRGAKDGFDADGNYSYTPAGRGRQAVGGFKGALDNAGGIASAATFGYAIGTLINDTTGLSKAISGSIEWNGKLYDATDKTTMQFIRLERGAQSLDVAVRAAAAAAGKFGSTGIVNARGQASQYGAQANAIRDFLRTQHAAGATDDLPFGLGGAMDFAGKAMGIGTVESLATGNNRAQLEALGLDPSKVTAAMADEFAAKAARMENESAVANTVGLTAFHAGMSQLTDYQRQTLDVEKAQEAVLNHVLMSVQNGIPFDPTTVMEVMKGLTADPKGTHKSVAGKPNVNVTIQRIEVQSDDPDRFAFGMVEAFRDAAKNPSSALSTLREG